MPCSDAHHCLCLQWSRTVLAHAATAENSAGRGTACLLSTSSALGMVISSKKKKVEKRQCVIQGILGVLQLKSSSVTWGLFYRWVATNLPENAVIMMH